MRVSRPWADQVAELLGAASLAAGAGFSAWRVAPALGLAALPTASAVAVAGMIIGWALVGLAVLLVAASVFVNLWGVIWGDALGW